MLTRLTVSPKFWQLFPEASISVVVAKGVDNHTAADTQKLLAKANQNAVKWLPEEAIGQNPVVQDWRQAYHQFKTKRGARSSVENLLKRAKQGKGVGSINPIVDLYNIVSLTWAFPLGGQDMDLLQGQLALTIAQGGEHFFPIGEDSAEEALPGEVIYQDEESVVCRCWNWRDSDRVAISEDSQNIIFYLENVNPKRQADQNQAVQLLQHLLQKYLGVQTQAYLVNQDNSALDFRK